MAEITTDPLAGHRGHLLDGPSTNVTDSEHSGHRRHEAVAGDYEPFYGFLCGSLRAQAALVEGDPSGD